MAPSSAPSKGLRRLPPRSASFNGRTEETAAPPPRQMLRPKTHPDVLAAVRRPSTPQTSFSAAGRSPEVKLPAKVLVSVTVLRSTGPVQVMAALEWTVDELVSAALRIYIQEERRPSLPSGDPALFGLHYSQFSLESLDSREKLINLGSRGFFLCPRADSANAVGGNRGSPATPPETAVPPPWKCRRDAEKGGRIGIPWLNFMYFLM
ncbi:hypothetical protein KSP39_PZI011208 [Platanthera zijinensis]|uniref:DUF7054 domain-containing protein n=1 Tax=Platanthera zijinensis TaxID=2320716 RepID=A0AAP0G5G9_9ASPA